jgi:N,N'-diacetyllegionaminate synthase
MVASRTIVPIEIAGRKVGPGHPCFIIAEAGVNHNGDPHMARQLVDAAIESGADAVKFQSFITEEVITPGAPKAEYQKETTGSVESQFDMVKRLELSPESHRDLKNYCDSRGILFMSSPFDVASADLLSQLDVAVFKIPSGEITNLPFLAHIAGKGKPMIVSTGMAYLSEVETAVHTIEKTGNREYTLLHCVSNYPADPADVNLMAMGTMLAAFGVPVGYSDHTLGIDVPIAAVALGASVVEKHLTLDQSLPGPDHRASLEPGQFKAMVSGIRNVESALGHGRKEPAASEANTASVARKSLVAAQDIAAGAVLTEALVAIKRPGTGLPPAVRPHLVGRTARKLIPAGTQISLEMLA